MMRLAKTSSAAVAEFYALKIINPQFVRRNNIAYSAAASGSQVIGYGVNGSLDAEFA